MSLFRLAGHKLYTSQEARNILAMLGNETTRELAIEILVTSKKRLAEDQRRALFRELNHLKNSVGEQRYTWTFRNGNFVQGVPLSKVHSEEDKALLENVRRVEWLHSKKTYTTQDWQKNKKKEYRRSAKNHYS